MGSFRVAPTEHPWCQEVSVSQTAVRLIPVVFPVLKTTGTVAIKKNINQNPSIQFTIRGSNPLHTTILIGDVRFFTYWSSLGDFDHISHGPHDAGIRQPTPGCCGFRSFVDPNTKQFACCYFWTGKKIFQGLELGNFSDEKKLSRTRQNIMKFWL